MFRAKKYLDIGGHDGEYVLQKCFNSPRHHYFFLDIVNLGQMRLDTPEGVINNIKGVLAYNFCRDQSFSRDTLAALRMPHNFYSPSVPYKNILKELFFRYVDADPHLREEANRLVQEIWPKRFGRVDMWYKILKKRSLQRMSVYEFMKWHLEGGLKDWLEKYTSHLHFIQGDGRKLPFKDNTFDEVSARDQDTEIREALYKEARRVAKNNRVLTEEGWR